MLPVCIREPGVLEGRMGFGYPEWQRRHAEIDFSSTPMYGLWSTPFQVCLLLAACTTSQELPNKSLGNTLYHPLEAPRSPGIITWAQMTMPASVYVLGESCIFPKYSGLVSSLWGSKQQAQCVWLIPILLHARMPGLSFCLTAGSWISSGFESSTFTVWFPKFLVLRDSWQTLIISLNSFKVLR